MKKQLFIFCAALCSISALAQTLPAYLPTAGLIGWWPFNGNANDESGNSNNGTVNGATLTADRNSNLNSAYNFNGINNYISCPPIPITGTSARTISFWYKESVSQAGFAITWGPANTGERFEAFFNYQNPGITVGAAYSAINYSYLNNTSASNWNFYCLVLPNLTNPIVSDIIVYQNGINITNILNSFNPNTPINTTSGYPLQFGIAYQSTNNWLNGQLDDIGIWNRALTQQEINSLYTGCGNSITSQPINQTVVISNSAQFTTAASDVNATYQWQTNLGVGFQNLSNVSQYSGVNTATLTINNISISNDNQTFRCIAGTGLCSDTSDVATLSLSPVSVTELMLFKNITIYPNPAARQVTIIADAKLSGTVFTVYNYTGKSVIEGKINSENTLIDLENLSEGIYLINIGENIKQTFKVIKQ